MKKCLKLLFLLFIIPFVCFSSSCSNQKENKDEKSNTLQKVYENTITVLDYYQMDCYLRESSSHLFIVNSKQTITAQFLLTFSRIDKKHDEDIVIERFADKEMKSLINNYNYNYFLLVPKTYYWGIYFEININPDSPIYLNVRGKNYLGGKDSPSNCDSFRFCFDYRENLNNKLNVALSSFLPIMK